MHTLREFMTKILRLESLVCGEQGGIVGEAIRACNRRLDNHKATMDDFYARIRIQDWYHDLSEQEDEEESQQSAIRAAGHDTNAENQPGVENRPPVGRFQRPMPRPPPPVAHLRDHPPISSPQYHQLCQHLQHLVKTLQLLVPPEPSRVSATHFSTVRSEVRSGAIRIDISNPEQWSAGDTAILRNQDPDRFFDTKLVQNLVSCRHNAAILTSSPACSLEGYLLIRCSRTCCSLWGFAVAVLNMDSGRLRSMTRNRDMTADPKVQKRVSTWCSSTFNTCFCNTMRNLPRKTGKEMSDSAHACTGASRV